MRIGCDIFRGLPVAFVVMMCDVFHTGAQELNCVVEVNTTAIEGTYKNIFEDLQRDMTEYINGTVWTDTRFLPSERIDCRMFLTVNEYSGGVIKGDLQVQLSRPVYNSNYTTTMFNYKDTKVEFDYKEGDQLVRNEYAWEGNLTGLLDFYSFMFLALDFDSFSLKGGQPYYDKAARIVQLAQSSGDKGWRPFEDNRNRSALLSAFTDGATSSIREFFYEYHRKGLDEMSTSPEKGRKNITGSLSILKDIYGKSPMTVALPLFRDAKLEELVNIYSEAPESERETVYDILNPIFPTDSEFLDRILKPQ